ncbi:hypothetical protein [Chitinophaga tropicalis]|uniref:Uncharacterized protein n=1 Tax=Chitinophaga tropicalis TaxID=2683588 RepID=A0A7K1UAQ0_9BACT|nr:hypothetical protein [Chitinophaga tropicalis]MVT11376.1 hypothetical protein [Chitinophaga tropicalis]
MSSNKYIKIKLDGQPLDLTDTDIQISINYQVEDTDDFTKKKSSEAFNITVPATINNDQLANTLHNPDIEDMTDGKAFRSYRNGSIEANGDELLVGKAFLTSATHTNRPISYQYDFYGNNGDWIIPLKETTLFDLLKHINFTFTKDVIVDSWEFNGRLEGLPYVFAPVRYRAPMDIYDETIVDGDYKDDNMTALYMKPSISVYWLIYWGLKSVGYQIQSTFMDTDYFVRQVMPWTWGNFLNAEGNRQDNLKFLAKGTERVQSPNNYDAYIDVKASNDFEEGGYDTNNVYTYSSVDCEMKWTYPTAFDYKTIKATFNLQIDWEVLLNTNREVLVRVDWIVNGGAPIEHEVVHASTGPTFGFQKRDVFDDFFTVEVNALDTISAKVYVKTTGTSVGVSWAKLEVIQFTISDITIPLGGEINFENYNGLKNYKFLDFLAGIFDCYNIIPGTDPVNKVVLMEPAHPYSLDNSATPTHAGYFNADYLDWNDKQDLSKESTIELYRDYERELTMKFKDDSNDGLLKVVQERNSTTLAAAKYVFPERFKAEKKDLENRFFSPVMHYEVAQWQGIATPAKTPQMICIVPENVSNTSNEESQHTFAPKLAYYKGVVSDAGGWRFDGDEYTTFPFMFAVNYQPGGQDDPILSYCDEITGSARGKGLLRRFFLQRFAIMRNGQFYTTFFRLNNKDATNWYHREHKICRGQRWELVKMTNYRPLSEGSTECYLRKWSPITEEDYNSVFPSFKLTPDKYDTKYSPLKCLAKDVPGPLNETEL